MRCCQPGACWSSQTRSFRGRWVGILLIFFILFRYNVCMKLRSGIAVIRYVTLCVCMLILDGVHMQAPRPSRWHKVLRWLLHLQQCCHGNSNGLEQAQVEEVIECNTSVLRGVVPCCPYNVMACLVPMCRVLIVDWDVHHGDGTQKMFWDDKRCVPVLVFVCLHACMVVSVITGCTTCVLVCSGVQPPA